MAKTYIQQQGMPSLIKLIILAILSYSSIVILVLIAISSKMNLPTKLMAGITPAAFIIFIAFFFKKTFGNWKKAIRAFLLLLP